jgi:hypothetical protein
VATRVLALDKGYEFGMVNPELFKGRSFMKLEHEEAKIPAHPTEFQEKKVVEDGIDIRGYDPEINFVEDNTIIDGEFQDLRYFEHRLPEIREWLKVEPLEIPNNVCIIGFRAGEFVGVRDLFLTLDYWEDAIDIMKEKGITKFEVHTDDPITAQKFFPNYKIIHDIGLNWRSVRYAKYAIIANSSFYILPRLLRHSQGEYTKHPITIAPRYWARRNIGVWALPSNYYKQFTYI